MIITGVNPTEIRGKRVGVFMGSTIGENDQLFMESVVSGFGVTGHSRAMLANRISYWLNLKGRKNIHTYLIPHLPRNTGFIF